MDTLYKKDTAEESTALHERYLEKIHGLITERDALREQLRQQNEELDKWGGEHRKQMLQYKQGLAATLDLLEKQKDFLYGEEELPGESLSALREQMLEPEIPLGTRIVFFFYQLLFTLFVAVSNLRIRSAQKQATKEADVQITELTQQIQARETDMEAREARLRQEIQGLRDALSQENMRSEQYQQTIRTIQQDLTRQTGRAEQYEQHAKDLQRALSEQSDRVEQYEQQARRAISELERQTAQMEQYERKAKELGDEMARLDEVRRRQAGKIRELEKDLDQTKEDNSRLRAEASWATARLRRTRALLWTIVIVIAILVVVAVAGSM